MLKWLRKKRKTKLRNGNQKGTQRRFLALFNFARFPFRALHAFPR